MTSFHDILGTDKNTSGADVKRRYKLLSSRLHPDKGGSKAMMQLLVQAYEKVNQDKGHEEAVRTIYAKDTAADSDKSKLKRLEREFQVLRRANEELSQLLTEEQNKNRQSAEQSERYTNASEDELKWLRRENRRLKNQLEEARWERSENRSVTSPSSEASSSLSMNELSPKVLSQIKALGRFNLRRLSFFLMTPLLIAGLLFTLGKEPWLAILAMFDEPLKQPEARVTILDSNPADNIQPQSQPTLQPVRAVPEKPEPMARIQLESTVGLWQLRYFENSNRPYISVRSEKGSYVIKSCDSDFQYYRNSNLRAGRLAANLIFERQERHFLIYNIPYGNGSFAANWSESQSLLINKEYFPNEGFSDVYYRLQQACSI